MLPIEQINKQVQNSAIGPLPVNSFIDSRIQQILQCQVTYQVETHIFMSLKDRKYHSNYDKVRGGYFIAVTWHVTPAEMKLYVFYRKGMSWYKEHTEQMETADSVVLILLMCSNFAQTNTG